MTNSIQKKLKVSSTQLLYQSCPYQSMTLFVIGPFLDWLLTNKNVLTFNYTPQVLVSLDFSANLLYSTFPILIFFLPLKNKIKSSYNLHVIFFLQFFIALSCLISVSVNFSTFLVIGKTSAVTYQVLGHLKTCLVLAFGYVLLHDPFSWRNILGILVAVVGMVLYSYYCTVERQRKANEVSAQLSQVVHIFPFCTVMYMPLFTFSLHLFCLEITNQGIIQNMHACLLVIGSHPLNFL